MCGTVPARRRTGRRWRRLAAPPGGWVVLASPPSVATSLYLRLTCWPGRPNRERAPSAHQPRNLGAAGGETQQQACRRRLSAAAAVWPSGRLLAHQQQQQSESLSSQSAVSHTAVCQSVSQQPVQQSKAGASLSGCGAPVPRCWALATRSYLRAAAGPALDCQRWRAPLLWGRRLLSRTTGVCCALSRATSPLLPACRRSCRRSATPSHGYGSTRSTTPARWSSIRRGTTCPCSTG